MDWFIQLFTSTESVAHIAILYAIVIALGVYLGKIKIGGISLGVTFVLFTGIVAGHFGFTGPNDILTFIQDFGLILFVFMIGLQVGPGFFASFREGGMKLNSLATVMILLNVAVMFACYYIFFDTSDPDNLPMMVGTLYGAVTNTPGLGAANEALESISKSVQIASGYACAYPLGVVGIIGAMVVVKYLCKVNFQKEEEQLEKHEQENANVKPHHMHLQVSNSYLSGRTLMEIHRFLNRDFVCSRILHNGHVSIPNGDTIFELGDQIYVVCAEADAEAIVAFIGSADRGGMGEARHAAGEPPHPRHETLCQRKDTWRTALLGSLWRQRHPHHPPRNGSFCEQQPEPADWRPHHGGRSGGCREPRV